MTNVRNGVIGGKNMGTKFKRIGIQAMSGTMAMTLPAIAACSIGPTYEEWAATDGAAGRINLDAVQDAFKRSKSASDFERQVNEIYEGDGLILILAKNDENGLIVEGWEDLNNDSNADPENDDLLFSITEGQDNNHGMRGYGANGYYNNGFGGSGFLFGYLVGSAFVPRGYYYHTPPTAAPGLKRQRDTYRRTSRYRSQVSTNSKYFSRQKSFAGSKYTSSGKNVSNARGKYMSTQKSTGNFKSSSTGVRSSWGSTSRSAYGSRGSRGGGFRGYGGGQRIIGVS